MLTLEYKLDGTSAQYAAIDEGIRVVQFIRNKCLRAWMDRLPEGKNFEVMSVYTAALAKAYAFAGRFGSQARQASAERAWAAVSRFYDQCQQQIPGKKGSRVFSMIAGASSTKRRRDGGWPRMAGTSPSSSGVGIGTLRLIGTRVKSGDQQMDQPLRSPAAYALSTIKRVRIVRRADGYFCQFCIAVCRVQAHEETGVELGIDVGLNAYYTDSEGRQVENPRFFRKAERKVAHLQRQVSRPERATQAGQEAERLSQAQPLPQRAARCSAPTTTPSTLAYPCEDQADHAPEPAAQAAEQAGDQPQFPACAGKAVTHLPESSEALGASASERPEAA